MRLHLKSWLAVVLLCSPAIAYNTVRPIHHAANIAIAQRWPQQRGRVGFLPMDQLLGEAGLQEGDLIKDFPVSSAFGIRERPCPGCSRFHRGVDLATPIGTPIYATASEASAARVSCHTDRKAGLMALVSSDEIPGATLKLMHLSDCFEGAHKQGSVIAKSGDSGESTTGPHLHFEEINRLGKHRDPRAGVASWLMTGQPPTTADSIELAKLSDEDILCAIALAEGTRDEDCQPNQHFAGHIDPGNAAHNLGSFSYQHGAASPEEADRLQLSKLRAAEKVAMKRAAESGISLSKIEMLSFLDQFNQSEEAALGSAGTLDRIIEARAQSYIDPATQQLNAPGLGNDITRVRADQQRRTEAIAQSLQKRRLERVGR